VSMIVSGKGAEREAQAVLAIDRGETVRRHLVEGGEGIPPLGRVVVGLNRDLLGHHVLLPRMSMVGRVADLLIHPLTGRVESLLYRPEPTSLRPSSTELLLGIEACGWNDEGALVISCPSLKQQSPSLSLENGGTQRSWEGSLSVLAKERLMGAQVVTREGGLLGRVTEIYFVPVVLQVLYQVSSSRWQQIFGRSRYLCGDLPYAYSPEARRLFVPADASRQAASSLSAAVGALIARQSPTLPSVVEKPIDCDPF
jgi:sporulation protein YlmC with PRC-barrel domain